MYLEHRWIFFSADVFVSFRCWKHTKFLHLGSPISSVFWKICIHDSHRLCFWKLISYASWNSKNLHPGSRLHSTTWKHTRFFILKTSWVCIRETCSNLHSENKPNFVNWKHSLFCILKASWVRVSWKNAQYCIHDKFCNLETPTYMRHFWKPRESASWKHAQFCILENCWKLLNAATGNTLYSAF